LISESLLKLLSIYCREFKPAIGSSEDDTEENSVRQVFKKDTVTRRKKPGLICGADPLGHSFEHICLKTEII
jgi:hypothetical protein